MSLVALCVAENNKICCACNYISIVYYAIISFSKGTSTNREKRVNYRMILNFSLIHYKIIRWHVIKAGK